MVRGSLMLTLLLAPCAFAASAPPPGLLEYLGAMVESDGQLIDPLALEAVAEEITVESAVTTEPENDDAGLDATTDQPAVSKEEDR